MLVETTHVCTVRVTGRICKLLQPHDYKFPLNSVQLKISIATICYMHPYGKWGLNIKLNTTMLSIHHCFISNLTTIVCHIYTVCLGLIVKEKHDLHEMACNSFDREIAIAIAHTNSRESNKTPFLINTLNCAVNWWKRRPEFTTFGIDSSK